MRKVFRRGLAISGAVALWMYILVFRPWQHRWGATDEEVRRTLPGDDQIPHPNTEVTRAITIKARPADIWPWLMQIGQGRGGYYSYTWIENLMGLRMKNSDQINPEWQHLKAGDIIPAEPGGSGFRVISVKHNRALVIGGRETDDDRVFAGFKQMFPAFTWAFVLEKVDNEHTRLITRFRGQARRSPLVMLTSPFFELGEFLMTRKMLLGIKQRAEQFSEQVTVRVGKNGHKKPQLEEPVH